MSSVQAATSGPYPRGKGLAIFVVNSHFTCHSPRPAAGKDLTQLRGAFGFLNFDIVECFDFTAEQIRSRVQQVAGYPQLVNYACIVIVVSTHGTTEIQQQKHPEGFQILETFETISGSDESLPVRDIIDPFSEANCPALRGKAKLFFLQACRGDKESVCVPQSSRQTGPGRSEEPMDTGEGYAMDVVPTAFPPWHQDQQTSPSVAGPAGPLPSGRRAPGNTPALPSTSAGVKPKVSGPWSGRLRGIPAERRPQHRPVRVYRRRANPLTCDQLIMWSCLSGFASYHHRGEGSPFIVKLCEVLWAYGRTWELGSLLLEVSRVVSEIRMPGGEQVIPCVEDTLRGDVYLC